MKHKFKPSKYYFTFGPHEPVLSLKAGDTLITTTLDAGCHDSSGNLIGEEMKQRSEDTEYHTGNPLVGPFYVEDADLKDTLVVHIEKIALNRESAYSRIRPHFASLTEEGPGKRLSLTEPLEERYFTWKLELEKNVGILNLSKSKLNKVEIPLHPFLGTIGVAPRYGRQEMSLTPGSHGGNMDCIETRKGTTLYFPVFVRGAYLAFGDVHAAQGDGEICGVALETTAEVTLRLDIIKGRAIEWPRFEDREYIMVAGSSRPLMEAFKIAYVEMTNWLTTDYGFEKWEAFQLLSQVNQCSIGNVCDPNYTVVAKFPKKYLPR
ncbi:MAG: acetamidase [Nitrososphaeria archaeon]|nr:acetamidase [Nitrososphaeria archaeon]NIN52609.1 acetamidase [Nitrososphaeria archaeon]NIQ33084.1 acetamidase [Nitrososphaeria archaeon]